VQANRRSKALLFPCSVGGCCGSFYFKKTIHWSLSPPGEWQLQFEADIVEVFKEIAAVLERRGLTISPQIPWNILGDRQMKRWEEVRAIIEKTQSLEANHVSFEFPRAYHRFPSLSKNPQKTSPVILHL
jgi:sugar phosphate isomerase/epimerase